MKQKANLYSETADITAIPTNGQSTSLAREESVNEKSITETTFMDSPVLAETNQNPLRRRISNPTHGLKKLIRLAMQRIKPPPSLEEIQKMSDKKRAKLLETTLRNEARIASQRISRALADLTFCYVRRDQQGNITKKRLIVFDDIYSTEDAHWFHVNMSRWPWGVNSDEVIKQDVINHLSRAVGHKVNVRATPEAGIWYIIERASGMMGIPIHVTISDMWGRFPSTATGLTIPMGMTNNRKPVFDDIDDMTHVLVGGQTGGGKSNFLNVLICTLITRNNPNQLNLLLLDMKAGLEFQGYEHIPHLIKIDGVTDNGIIEHPDKVAPALEWLVRKEAGERLALIKASGHKDIKSYNVRRTNKLSRLIVIIDEWAAARMGNGGKEAEYELVKALQLLRAAGIHIVVCTQVPSKEVLGIIARANLPTRIALSCSELSASILLVGDGSALNLGNPGRAVMKRVSSTPIQIPYMSEEMVKEIVAGVMDGKYQEALTTPSHDVTITEMLAWGLHENGGSLRYQEIYNHFAHRGIPRKEVLDSMKGLDNKTMEIEGRLYRVEPGAGNKPRKLVAIENEDKTDETQN